MDYTPTATAEDGHGRNITAEKGDGEHSAGDGPAPVADGIEKGMTKLASTKTADDSPDQPIKVKAYGVHALISHTILVSLMYRVQYF